MREITFGVFLFSLKMVSMLYSAVLLIKKQFFLWSYKRMKFDLRLLVLVHFERQGRWCNNIDCFRVFLKAVTPSGTSWHYLTFSHPVDKWIHWVVNLQRKSMYTFTGNVNLVFILWCKLICSCEVELPWDAFDLITGIHWIVLSKDEHKLSICEDINACCFVVLITAIIHPWNCLFTQTM